MTVLNDPPPYRNSSPGCISAQTLVQEVRLARQTCKVYIDKHSGVEVEKWNVVAV